jgi:hypothetical protein
MPRFVILHHEMPADNPRGSHWDLMFERGAALRTWAVASEPATDPPIEAEQLADHRLAYLEYEGLVSGDRGTVTQWDTGEYRLESDTEVEWVAAVSGRRLKGRMTITRLESPHSWRVSFTAAPTSG